MRGPGKSRELSCWGSNTAGQCAVRRRPPTASRRQILCWDVRGTGDVVYRLPRHARTNQRLHFDLDPAGRFLLTPSQPVSEPPGPPPAPGAGGRGGGPCGEVLVYDLRDGAAAGRFGLPTPSLNGISLHPARAAFAASAGQRRFPLPPDLPAGPPSPGSPSPAGGAREGPGPGEQGRDRETWDRGLFVGRLLPAGT